MRYSILTTIAIFAILSVNGQQVTDAEYFWGTDPGAGNGNAMVAFDGNFDDAVEIILNEAIEVLEEGAQLLSIRVRDDENNWGPAFTVVVNVSEPISEVGDINVTAAEYFFNDDPGPGSGTPMLALDGDFDAAVETIVNDGINVPDEGVHLLSIRARDEENNWGPVFTVVVNVAEPLSEVREIKVTAAEYYFNNDPGPGNGTPMLAVNGDFSEAIEALKGGGIPSPIEEGIHVLWMRARDAENIWGPSFGVVVNMDTTITGFDAVVLGPESLCSGDEQLNAAYSTQVTPGGIYTWTATNGSITSGQGTANITVDWDADGPYSVHLEKCLGDVCEEDELTVNIHPTFEMDDELSICFGEEVMLGGAMQSESGIYTDVYESVAGCDSTVNTTLTVLDEIELNIEASATEICAGEEVTLTASGADQLSWSDGVQNGEPFTPDETQSYSVTGTTNGCSSEVTVDVIVNPLPEVTLSGDVPELVCVYVAPIDLTFGSPAGGTWSGPGVTDDQFNPESAGVGTHTLTYSYTDENDCSAEAEFTIEVDVCTSVGDRENEAGIELYPNPASNICWVAISGTHSGIDRIALHDAMGRLIKMLPFSESDGKQLPIDISELAPGTYIVNVVSGDMQVHRRLVIAR